MRCGSRWWLLLCCVLAVACTRGKPDGDTDAATPMAGTSAAGTQGSHAGTSAAGHGGESGTAPSAGASGTQSPPVAGSVAGRGVAGAGAAGAISDASIEDGAAGDAGSAGLDAGSDAATDEREPPSPTAVYSATRYIGGLDHLRIQKRDDARGYCSGLSLTSPPSSGGDPQLTVEVPEMWGFSAARAVSPSSSCETPTDMDVHAAAVSAIGRISVREPGASFYPCSIDIDVELTFAPMGAIPAKDRFLIEDLATPCE